jgi:hypothetical protein
MEVVEGLLTIVVFDHHTGNAAATSRYLSGWRLHVGRVGLYSDRRHGLPFLSIQLPETVGFRLGVKEKPLITVLRARPRLDLGDQRSCERDPTLGALSTKGGSAPVGAQAYAVFIRIERLQVGAKAIIIRGLLPVGYVWRRRR